MKSRIVRGPQAACLEASTAKEDIDMIKENVAEEVAEMGRVGSSWTLQTMTRVLGFS